MNEDTISAFIPIVGILIPIVAIVGGIVLAITATISKGRQRELEIRERIAMIERGLVPPPEKDPGGFERVMRKHELVQGGTVRHRLRGGGVMMIGIGLGIALMLGLLSGDARVGVGIGGFLVLIGIALLVNSFVQPTYHSSLGSPASGPPEQPHQ